MIVAQPLRHGWHLTRRTVLLAGVACLSLVAAYAAMVMQWYAVGIAVAVALVALTVWRPRYGLYAVTLLALALEPTTDDPISHVGWMIQSNISSWSPLGFVNFSPVELLLIVVTVVVLLGALVGRQSLKTSPLWWPMLVFLALVTFSTAWGVLRGGTLNIALWETRNLYVIGLVALLVPNVLASRGQARHTLNLLCIGAIVLSLDIIRRRFALDDDGGALDLVFAHETPVFLNAIVVLLLARLIWPASAAQRWMALAIPLILYAEMLTERRAGWICLYVSLAVLAIFLFRLRRPVFWAVVVPGIVFFAGYAAVFWNADGPVAQPVRAVRSISDPEARDRASNEYRVTETANVRINIKASPLTGLGFGQQYVFYYPLPDLSWWVFWRYMPHNAFLWLWMKMGVVGFIAFLGVIGVAVVRGVQMLKRATGDLGAPTLVTATCIVLMSTVYTYVDLGLTNVRSAVLLGLAMGIIAAWSQLPERTPARGHA